jgi:predicted protein tyrosine phosphatase
MKEIYSNLFIGVEQDCRLTPRKGWATVHACKHPCHSNAVGFKASLNVSHPHYLVMEKDQQLYLNITDIAQELSPNLTNPVMKAAMLFIDKHFADKKILIHCNQALSRSPSIGLLYLARIGYIANDSYSNAVSDFRKLYPIFHPGTGIALYLNNNWDEVLKL